MTPVAVTRSETRAAPRIAILIPCYNEAITITDVVTRFKAAVPGCEVYVFDNNSTDDTSELARAAGATVCFERRQGKGYVVQSMFRKVDADIYVMVDGDGTYPPDAVERLLAPIESGEADMVIGSRLHRTADSEFRLLNRLGNRFFLRLLNSIFGVRLTDLLSGYRAFSRRLVRSLPLFGGGFETEAELTIKALQRGYAIVEVPVDLKHRPAGSHSKIRIVQDGLVILSTILTLFRDYKPLTFFGATGLGLMAAGALPGAFALLGYVETGVAPGLLTGVAVLGLLIGALTIGVGLVLHTIARRFQELDYQLQMFADEAARGRGRENP